MSGQTDAVRRPLARTGRRALAALALALLLAPSVHAQPVTWEALPLIREFNLPPQKVTTLGFLRGEGAAAADPAADTLVAFTDLRGAFLYNPSGAAGAAGDNDDWGAWHHLCDTFSCTGNSANILTASNTMLTGSVNDPGAGCRATNRGRDWTCGAEAFTTDAFHESHLPFPESTTGLPTLFLGYYPDELATVGRSFEDGAPGSWTTQRVGLGDFMSFVDVPPSAALPRGRLLAGSFGGGVIYADDGGLTWHRSSLPNGHLGYSLTFMPVAGHPYGGVAFVGSHNARIPSGQVRAEVYRSDDGGVTWSFVYRFSPEEIGRASDDTAGLSRPEVFATADGVLWCGVGYQARSLFDRGGIVRSTDMGQTWQRADAGYTASEGGGWRVDQLMLARDGRLYAATVRGVWRTTGSVFVAAEAPPEAPPSLGVSVRPNPVRSRVAVTLTQPARVVVFDALGREVAVVPEASSEVLLDTASWPAGVYVVRATAGAETATARLVVTR